MHTKEGGSARTQANEDLTATSGRTVDTEGLAAVGERVERLHVLVRKLDRLEVVSDALGSDRLVNRRERESAS